MRKPTAAAKGLPSLTSMGALLEKIAAKRPLVHNITNFVAMDVSANVLLAVGASPAMVSAIEEVAEFIALADALVINIGTLSRPALESMLVAAATARARGKPWVLDPVGAGATGFRDAAVAALLLHKPAVIRGNASEIMAVAKIAGLCDSDARPRGVDSANSVREAELLAVALARAQGCTVAATGAVDFVTDGTRRAHVGNGSAMMPLVTALGCALSALTAAFAAAESDAFAATCAALLAYGIAGQAAGEEAEGPGSFRMVFLDMLHCLDHEQFVMQADFRT